VTEIIPGILTDDSGLLEDLLKQSEGVFDRVQIDVLDGVYADNKTVDPSFLDDSDYNFKIDYHLMVNEPVNWVERCARGMADRIIGQIEKMQDQIEFVGKVQESGSKVGLAIDLDTSVTAIDKAILTDLDVVLVMSVRAGFDGQKFDRSALLKIRELDKIRKSDQSPYRICIDGGVTKGVIKEVRDAGTDDIAIGKRIFKGDVQRNFDEFRKALDD